MLLRSRVTRCWGREPVGLQGSQDLLRLWPAAEGGSISTKLYTPLGFSDFRMCEHLVCLALQGLLRKLPAATGRASPHTKDK